MLVEYKYFEPAFYATALPDWGTAFAMTQKLGPQAKVLVDLGHHAQGANIEQVVAQLARLGRLGGFHFNDRKYGDDDLATGSLDPAQLFRIFNVLVEADRAGIQPIAGVSFVIDQSHNVKNPIEEMIESVEAILRAYVQALCVDRGRWQEAQASGDAELGDQLLKNAMQSTPVDVILVRMREEKRLPPDPLAALRLGAYLEDRRRARRAPAPVVHAGL